MKTESVGYTLVKHRAAMNSANATNLINTTKICQNPIAIENVTYGKSREIARTILAFATTFHGEYERGNNDSLTCPTYAKTYHRKGASAVRGKNTGDPQQE